MSKKFYTLGCCGLDCGLCPRYYTKGSSKCPGCCGEDFAGKHPSCSFITCCVKKKNLEVCAECNDFPCARFDKETGMTDSFVTHRKVIDNQYSIKEYGIDSFMEQQKKRMNLLQTMLEGYDDGNCKSFFCLSAALLSLESLNESITLAKTEIDEKSIDNNCPKAKVLKQILNQFAAKENMELKLRKEKK